MKLPDNLWLMKYNSFNTDLMKQIKVLQIINKSSKMIKLIQRGPVITRIKNKNGQIKQRKLCCHRLENMKNFKANGQEIMRREKDLNKKLTYQLKINLNLKQNLKLSKIKDRSFNKK